MWIVEQCHDCKKKGFKSGKHHVCTWDTIYTVHINMVIWCSSIYRYVFLETLEQNPVTCDLWIYASTQIIKKNIYTHIEMSNVVIIFYTLFRVMLNGTHINPTDNIVVPKYRLYKNWISNFIQSVYCLVLCEYEYFM